MRRKRDFPFNDIVYRSNYERRQAKRLTELGIEFTYEEYQISFSEDIVGGTCEECGSKKVIKSRKYTPDFYIPETNIFVETKGRFTAENRTKMHNVCNQSKEDVRMVFMSDNYLTKKHGMRYSRWCDLHDIKWAVGNIPLEWCTKTIIEEEN